MPWLPLIWYARLVLEFDFAAVPASVGVIDAAL
jgi:hypothetical protein